VVDESDQPARAQRSRHYDRRAELVERTEVTSTGTVRLTFRVVDGRPFVFVPGYFVSVESEVPGVGFRYSPYCLLSRPGQAPIFELIVRQVEGGQRSAYLGSLDVGDVLAFRGPGGHSMMPRATAADLVLLATGIGIAPLLCLAGELLDASFPLPIRLFWGLRLVEDVCLVDELEALAADYPNFSYRISLSQPPPAWSGLRGRLTESVPGLLGTLATSEFRLVGNGAMTEEMATALGDMGVGKEVIYREAYFNGKHRPDPATMAAIKARFVASDLLAPSALDAGDLFRLERPLGQTKRKPPPSRP
jgi:ferredoxin-NADP reductase